MDLNLPSHCGVPVKDHGEAEVGEGDLHDETAADPVHLLEVIVAVQQGQASGDRMELYIKLYISYISSRFKSSTKKLFSHLTSMCQWSPDEGHNHQLHHTPCRWSGWGLTRTLGGDFGKSPFLTFLLLPAHCASPKL